MTVLAPRLRSVVRQIERDGISSLRSERSRSATDSQLEAEIAGVIYDRFHARWVRDPGFRVSARDLAFEGKLRAVTPHRTTLTDLEVLERSEAYVLVTIEGVVVRLPPDIPLKIENGRIRAEIPAVRPVLSPGFLLVDGAPGKPVGTHIARFYVHLSCQEQAIAVWRLVLSSLENLGIGYRAKVASNQGMLPRSDALVIYCASVDSSAVRIELSSALTEDVLVDGNGSVFTEEIKPGLTYAEEPSSNAGGDLSFGQHRSRAVARAVLRSARQGWADSEGLVVRELEASGINPNRPWEDLRPLSPELRHTT